jgi:predicted enzyme related to lactoylglutathione lyase
MMLTMDVDAARERVVATGREVTLEKMAIPGVGSLVFARDRNGLYFGVLQGDEDAGG